VSVHKLLVFIFVMPEVFNRACLTVGRHPELTEKTGFPLNKPAYRQAGRWNDDSML
jgi:hypothetical protein